MREDNSGNDGGRRSIGGVWGQDWTEAGQRANPLLFMAVLDLIGRGTVMNDAMKKLLNADDQALVANGKQELQETLEE